MKRWVPTRALAEGSIKTSFKSLLSSRTINYLSARGFFEFDPESAPSIRLGFDADLTPHPFERFAHNGKTDAGAFVCSAWVRALEHQEDSFVRLLADANPVILE